MIESLVPNANGLVIGLLYARAPRVQDPRPRI